MKAAPLRVRIYLGLFALAFLGLAAGAILLLGDGASLFGSSRRYSARFANTSGLIKGAPVRMSGVEVGRVEKIEIDSESGAPLIKATLAIDADYAKLLRRDATVALDSQGVLGDKFIALNAGTTGGELAEGALIDTRELGGLSRVVEQSNAIVDSVASTSLAINRFAAGLPSHDELEAITKDLAASVKNMRQTTAKISADDALFKLIRDAETAENLRRGLASFAAAGSHAESITRKIDAGEGTLGALVNDRQLYEDLRNILGQADRGQVARRIFREAQRGQEPDEPAAPASSSSTSSSSAAP